MLEEKQEEAIGGKEKAAPEMDEKLKKAQAFLEEYKVLCDKHGLELADFTQMKIQEINQAEVLTPNEAKAK